MKEILQEKTLVLPASSSSFLVNLAACLVFLTSLFWLPALFPHWSVLKISCVALFLMFLIVAGYELLVLKVYQRASTNLHLTPDVFNPRRWVIKLIGLYGTFLFVGICYRVIPFYQGDFYKPYFKLLAYVFPVVVVLSVVYFYFFDRRQKDPQDEYWHIGCLLTGRWQEISWIHVREHFLIWFIKWFFTPIMFCILIDYVKDIYAFQWQGWPQSFFPLYNLLMDLLYLMDVSFGIIGYILTLRMLDNHIRSTEPTWFGWAVCLACYSPFYAFLYHQGIFQYEDGFEFQDWFALNPVKLYVFAFLILSGTCLYAMATVAIGYRISNLTYRGIITNGPYRWTKHPAYLGKIVSWWLISIPFLSLEEPLVTLKYTLSLMLLSLIFFLRALTEENHLSNYPEYVKYANWINQHGIFSFVTKHFPVLQYSEEKSKKWNSVVWFKKLKN